MDFWQYEREVTLEELRENNFGLANERDLRDSFNH